MYLSKGANQAGFTLVELLVVIGIIGVLSGVVLSNLNEARKKASVVKAGFIQKNISRSISLYYDDMGFYPPDVNRGWDPGLVQAMPWNPDEATSDPPSGSYVDSGTDCSHCPSNWEDLVADRWNGPYVAEWPRFTPWQGKYDYNYWPIEAERGGCLLPPGIYFGVQGDYENNNTISPDVEADMINKGFDSENCVNGESQMLLWEL